MRTRLSWLLTLILLVLLPRRAEALSTTSTYAAIVDGGPAGTMRFELDSAIAGVACRYVYVWVAEDGLATTQCSLTEETWVGNMSCVADALVPINGIVEAVNGHGCAGFDGTSTSASVFMLMLGEHAGDGELDGIIQYSGAFSFVSEFEAVIVH